MELTIKTEVGCDLTENGFGVYTIDEETGYVSNEHYVKPIDLVKELVSFYCIPWTAEELEDMEIIDSHGVLEKCRDDLQEAIDYLNQAIKIEKQGD